MTYDRILQHKLAVKDIEATEDRKKIITTDNGSRVYVWNVADWSLLASIDPALNESNYFENVVSADADDTGIYTATDHELIKYDYKGGVIYKKDFEDVMGIGPVVFVEFDFEFSHSQSWVKGYIGILAADNALWISVWCIGFVIEHLIRTIKSAI